MMLNYFKLSVVAFCSLAVCVTDGYAQQFGGSRSPAVQNVEQSAPSAAMEKETNEPNLEQEALDILHSVVSKTKDGSKKGDLLIIKVPTAGQTASVNEDKELIFLYYENFEITRGFAGNVGCNVRFVVTTTLNERLSNLSVKLKWPDMTTSLSFDDVNPHIATYYNYALFGEGCYTMDKIPNIIVNRCRIKGMSQQDCAKKIRWLTLHGKLIDKL